MLSELAVGARLFPLSRFTGKPASQLIRRYSRLLNHYVSVERLQNIMNNEPTFRQKHMMMKRALHAAEYELDQGDIRKRPGINLSSVFSRISAHDLEPRRSEFLQYDYQVLTPENAFPCAEAANKGNNKLLRQFYGELDKLAVSPPKSDEIFEVVLDRILKRYTWCISASDYEGEDVSLYDYAKISQALAVCLEQAADLDHPYIMLGADFSGIQKYIFSIASANYPGTARQLRSRSFFVDVTSKVLSHAVAREFGVSAANILLQTGGKFYILLPNTADAQDKLKAFEKHVDQYLFDHFHGSVNMNTAWKVCQDEDLKNYSDTIVELNQLLSQSKARPFSTVLQGHQGTSPQSGNNGWNTESFVLCSDLGNKKLCPSCGQELIHQTEEECFSCRMYKNLGGWLPFAEFIGFYDHYVSGSFEVFDGFYVRPLESLQDRTASESYLIESLHGNLSYPESYEMPVSVRYMVNHLPSDGKQTLTFQEIADMSSGVSRLGVLKADVDSLGFLFAQGLRTKNKHFGTISRVNTMSRMLEVFFSGYIHQMLSEDEEFQNIYSVYSGGDDLFLLGPWDTIQTFAFEAAKAFQDFTGNNPDISLSAGIQIFSSRVHMAVLAEQTEEELERAKKEEDPCVYPDKGPKNAVCVMGTLLAWPDLEKQIKNAERLQNLLEEKSIQTGWLRRLGLYGTQYRRWLNTNDGSDLAFLPHMNYDVQRNYPDPDSKNSGNHPLLSWFLKEYVPSLQDVEIDRTLSVNKNLYFTQFTMQTALNSTRRSRNNGV